MKTMPACFAVLCQLRGIRRSVPRTVFQSLVSCLVLSLLDYFNAESKPIFGFPQTPNFFLLLLTLYRALLIDHRQLL